MPTVLRIAQVAEETADAIPSFFTGLHRAEGVPGEHAAHTGYVCVDFGNGIGDLATNNDPKDAGKPCTRTVTGDSGSEYITVPVPLTATNGQLTAFLTDAEAIQALDDFLFSGYQHEEDAAAAKFRAIHAKHFPTFGEILFKSC